MQTMKTCTKCHESKPATTDHFYQSKTGLNGLHAHCIECYRQYQRQYAQTHKEQNSRYHAKWWQKRYWENKQWKP